MEEVVFPVDEWRQLWQFLTKSKYFEYLRELNYADQTNINSSLFLSASFFECLNFAGIKKTAPFTLYPSQLTHISNAESMRAMFYSGRIYRKAWIHVSKIQTDHLWLQPWGAVLNKPCSSHFQQRGGGVLLIPCQHHCSIGIRSSQNKLITCKG